MKADGQMQAFLGNGDQHVSADCNPDLRLDRVLVGAIKRLDSQVLLDPFGCPAQVQGVSLVGLAVADVNECGDGAAQVQQGVHFDSRLVRAKRCPRINRQAQVYLRGIEGVNGCIQVDRHRLLGVRRARHGDQVLRKVGVDLPRPGCIGFGQSVARNGLAAQTHVIQPLGLSTQIDLDIAQRLAVGQLRKGHGQELVHAGEILNLVIGAVNGHASTESAQGQKRYELRENKLVLVHCCSLRANAKDHKSWNRSSNRDQTEMLKN
jgi:hypothetical protein